jgi:hypothetical protein
MHKSVLLWACHHLAHTGCSIVRGCRFAVRMFSPFWLCLDMPTVNTQVSLYEYLQTPALMSFCLLTSTQILLAWVVFVGKLTTAFHSSTPSP